MTEPALPEKECPADSGNDAEIRMLKETIRTREQKIRVLEMQIERLKAVDLELETSKPDEGRP